jgi:hypothetical protein
MTWAGHHGAAGGELLDPGVVSCSQWRPGPAAEIGTLVDVTQYGGLARKP